MHVCLMMKLEPLSRVRQNNSLTPHLSKDFHNGVTPFLNASYLTDSYIVFTLKMESVPKTKKFGLKMMVKSGLEFFF